MEDKLKIYAYRNSFYIGLSRLTRDRYVAQFLGIPTSDYREMLKEWNAFYIDTELYFKDIHDTQNCLEHLESLLIMNRMVE